MSILKGGVAFFDSGIGGLTVLNECRKKLPNETFYYYGDNENAPYGNLPPEKIVRFVFSAFEKFQELEVKAAVIACNTATAVCAELLREKYTFPIIGAEPAIFTAAQKGGRVFVLTTRATYESARFRALCDRAEKRFPQASVIPKACDKLAGEIEKRLLEKTYDFSSLLPPGKPDSVVLGCTHYIYLKEKIGEFYNAETFDGNFGMAKRLASFLEKMPTENMPGKAPVFFLGNSKDRNKYVFEQMFGK